MEQAQEDLQMNGVEEVHAAHNGLEEPDG
jgi:hypothetical protein